MRDKNDQPIDFEKRDCITAESEGKLRAQGYRPQNYFRRYYSAILGRVGLPRSIFYVYVSDNQRGAERGGNSGVLNRFCF